MRELQRAVRDLSGDAVIIGAMAYRIFIEDAERQTYDVDLAIALDLDELGQMTNLLSELGWRADTREEQFGQHTYYEKSISFY